jgi:isopentenyl phosphate kinase
MVKNKIIILKLGGSIITEKSSGKPKIRRAVIKQLVKELKVFVRRFPKTKIILLHGAGSFGHPLVYRHKLLKQPLTSARISGFAEVVCSMRCMANLLADIFLSAKLPVFPLQTSAVLNEKNNLSNFFHLKQILDAGFIPLLGGDMGLASKKQAVVVSADKLAVQLAKAFPNSKIIFATDVDGVFEKFPPSKNSQPLASLTRKKIAQVFKGNNIKKSQHDDVTGKMAGKLRAVLALRKTEVIVFNGLKPGGLTKALSGKPVGTRLEL